MPKSEETPRRCDGFIAAPIILKALRAIALMAMDRGRLRDVLGMASRTRNIIVVGPPRDMVGGMTSVVEQMLQLESGDRFQLEYFPMTIAGVPHPEAPGRIRRHLRHVIQLRRRIKRTGAAILHIHTCSGFSFYRSIVDMVMAQRMGCRTILHVHGARFDSFVAGERAWRRKLIAWALRRADRVVALSAGWGEKLRAVAPRAGISVIENAISIPQATPNERRKGPCRFLLLARMDHWKGIDDLLDACSRLRRTREPFEVTLAGPPGSAGDEAGLAEKIRKLGLDEVVRYVGPVAGQRKSSLLCESDVYVQPSHDEGLPMAVLEALAHGLPVVATRVGALPEVITHRREGLLVTQRSPDLLADAMRSLIHDVRLRRSMSAAARALASQRFNPSRFHADLLALFDDVTAGRPSPTNRRRRRGGIDRVDGARKNRGVEAATSVAHG